MDCTSASEADCVLEDGELVQWPNDRNPMCFIRPILPTQPGSSAAEARLGTMKIAHVRELGAPAGTPWRLAAAVDAGHAPVRWLDLEPVRRSQAKADPRLAHNSALHRQPPTTLDAWHAACGSPPWAS
jgi:hypothetical protein